MNIPEERRRLRELALHGRWAALVGLCDDMIMDARAAPSGDLTSIRSLAITQCAGEYLITCELLGSADAPGAFPEAAAAIERLKVTLRRQHASLLGQPELAHRLVHLELEETVRDGLGQCPAEHHTYEVVDLIRRHVTSHEVIDVLGVSRPGAAGMQGLGDPGSTMLVRLDCGERVERGMAIRITGTWDARRAVLSAIAPPVAARFPRYGALLALIGGRALGPSHARTDGGSQSQRAQWRHETAIRRNPVAEAAAMPVAGTELDRAMARGALDLGALCRVHTLLVGAREPGAGVLRSAPAVVRLHGTVSYEAPPPDAVEPELTSSLEVLGSVLKSELGPNRAVAVAGDTLATVTRIHPFRDGNGRVARALAGWILTRAGYVPRPSRHLDDFCHSHLEEYYEALRFRDIDRWTWHQFFRDAVQECFTAPSRWTASHGMVGGYPSREIR